MGILIFKCPNCGFTVEDPEIYWDTCLNDELEPEVDFFFICPQCKKIWYYGLGSRLPERG